jgi:hypothetical protein
MNRDRTPDYMLAVLVSAITLTAFVTVVLARL